MIDAGEFDYVIAGGGTAGCVVAARLSEDPNVTVCVIEAGPSDVDDPNILRLDKWMYLLDSGYDWDYLIEPQEKGNSFMRHARAKVLGGCSSHNSCIAFWTPKEDLDEWEAMGCTGWGSEHTWPLITRLETNDGPGDHHGRNGPVNIRTVPPHDPCGVVATRGGGAGRAADEQVQRGRDGLQRRRLVPDQLGARQHADVVLARVPAPDPRLAPEPRDPDRLLGQPRRHPGRPGARGRVPDPRSAHARLGQGEARGHPLGRRDRHAEAADAVGRRPRRAPPGVRDRDAGRLPRGRIEPRRPRRGDRPVGREEADGHDLDAVLGDRAVLDLRGRPRPARPDDALRLGPVRHEHGALGLPDDRERLLPDAERVPRALARDRASAHAAITATVPASTRATSRTPTATTSA